MGIKTVSVLVAALTCSSFAWANDRGTVDRLYPLDCGQIRVADQSRNVSPGLNAGKPLDMENSCYLIKRGRTWILWETGLPDTIADRPVQTATMSLSRKVTLRSELTRIGVTPNDVKYVIVSHSHADHSGNIEMFRGSRVFMQRVEQDFAFSPENRSKNLPYSRDFPLTQLDGDYDLFGDGSIRILSTPGHTPGHQSLLVNLRKTGPVLLTGDAVLTAESWKERWAPGFNKEQVLSSMDRLEKIVKQYNARLWSSHDAEEALDQRRQKYFR